MAIINNEVFVEMLADRLINCWNAEPHEVELFYEMWENQAESGVFDYQEVDVKDIVDNDWVNYCKIIDPNDEDYSIIEELWKKNDCCPCDISCESDYGYIESASEDLKYFLVRMR